MSKNDQQVAIENLEFEVEKQIEAAYNKLNTQIANIMGPELKKCIDQNSSNPKGIINCYDEFQRRISPVLERLGLKNVENRTTVQRCLQSKQNAKICAKIGLQKSNQYITEAFNDLKSYLA